MCHCHTDILKKRYLATIYCFENVMLIVAANCVSLRQPRKKEANVRQKHPSPKESSGAVRLDKWLWAARFYKTRSIARDMIDGGKVQYNGQRTKPSKIVELGAEIRLRQGHSEKTVTILKISEQRRGAPEAQTLYEETSESIARREQDAELRRLHAQNPAPDARPDKKQRRDLIKFKYTNN